MIIKRKIKSTQRLRVLDLVYCSISEEDSMLQITSEGMLQPSKSNLALQERGDFSITLQMFFSAGGPTLSHMRLHVDKSDVTDVMGCYKVYTCWCHVATLKCTDLLLFWSKYVTKHNLVVKDNFNSLTEKHLCFFLIVLFCFTLPTKPLNEPLTCNTLRTVCT